MRLSLAPVMLSTLVITACAKKPTPTPPSPEPTRVTQSDTTTEPAKPADATPPADPQKPAAGEPDAKPDLKPSDADKAPSAAITQWMAWEGGVDLVAMTKEGLQMPNVIFHVARMVHTPGGSAPSGMILWQPDADKPPVVAGFVSTDANVGAYFGPNIFAGTPFEKAPASVAEITITYDAAEKTATSKAKVGDHTFEATFSNIGDAGLINRAPAQMTPFTQQGVEAPAGKVVFKVDGVEVPLILPPVGLSGGPAAVFAATGIYAR